jgi:hypothetical protein
VSENPFNIICLFNFDAETYRVDGRLYENLFILVAGNVHWVQDDFRGGSAISGLETGYLASISGMLCRSTTWLEKFSRHKAAVRLARTQLK